MKKLITLCITATLMPLSPIKANEGDFYGKIFGGWSKLEDQYAKDNYNGKSHKALNVKAKAKNDFLLGIGIGTYVQDNIRLDLTFENISNTIAKNSLSKESRNNREDKAYGTYSFKSSIQNLQLNGFFDFHDFGKAVTFVGAGAGMSNIKSKYSRSYDSSKTKTASTKSQKRFSYAIHAGMSTELNDGLNLELLYSWKDFGKTGKFTSADFADGYHVKPISLKGHHVLLGLRIDM